MSEENKETKTNYRKFALADMAKHQKVKVEYTGDLYIVTENELSMLWGKAEKVEILESDLTKFKKDLGEQKAKNIELIKKIEDWKKAYLVKQKEAKTLEEELASTKNGYKRLVENYNALLAEYNKLKTFKENAGRGRAYSLTPEQVGFIRHNAIQGKTTKAIHEHLVQKNIKVSYETVRKIVAEMKKQ